MVFVYFVLYASIFVPQDLLVLVHFPSHMHSESWFQKSSPHVLAWLLIWNTHCTICKPGIKSRFCFGLSHSQYEFHPAEWAQFLQHHGIPHQRRFCDNDHEMVLHLSDKEDRWRCNVRDCRQPKQLKSGTWLQGSHLGYQQVILFIYCWSREYTSIVFCQEELGMSSNHTIVDLNNYVREVCAQALLNDPPRIGGPNITVEVDESLFVKRKANVGGIPEKQWVLGGVCRETNVKPTFLGAVLVCGLQKKCDLHKIKYCSSMRSTSYNWANLVNTM